MNVLTTTGARQAFLTGALSWTGASFKAVLVDETYVYDAAHDNLNDVTAGKRVATTGTLTCTAVAGVAHAADATISSPPVGRDVRGYWIYKDTGVESTSLLVAFIDTDPDNAPIEYTTDGTAILVVLDSGSPNGVFKL